MTLRKSLSFALAASFLVDLVWHAHILCSKQYCDFCEENFAGYLHHDPEAGGMLEYVATLDAYTSAYGPPPASIWPPVPACSADAAAAAKELHRFTEFCITKDGSDDVELPIEMASPDGTWRWTGETGGVMGPTWFFCHKCPRVFEYNSHSEDKCPDCTTTAEVKILRATGCC